jgi:ABC-type multidrug transport system ATPase subunit
MMARCAKLLDVLGLALKVNVPVLKLSGGEKKRLSVGIGMISNPNVLFLDEPTTGLDSTAAFSIVQYLSIVAKEMNVAVIMTIHQPSALVFDLLDSLYLLEV